MQSFLSDEARCEGFKGYGGGLEPPGGSVGGRGRTPDLCVGCARGTHLPIYGYDGVAEVLGDYVKIVF